MDKLKKIYFDLETKVQKKRMKFFIGMCIRFVIAILI